MTPPDVVAVGPFRYSVVLDQGAIDRKRAERGSPNLIGNVDRWALRILVAPELAPALRRETLLHEVLHGCAQVAGLDDAATSEEDWVDRLSPVLLDTLRRNPALVAHLTGDDDE